MKVEDFSRQSPTLILEDYFVGTTRAWGIFQDWRGNVTRQFVVDIDGKWDGKLLTLDEHFDFNDDEKSFRQWRIKRIRGGCYEGAADDVVGTATGKAAGNSLNWVYTLDLKTGKNRTLQVKFDDWMFLQPDGVLLNRARMSRFGIKLGDVTISFAKIDADKNTESMHSRPGDEANAKLGQLKETGRKAVMPHPNIPDAT